MKIETILSKIRKKIKKDIFPKYPFIKDYEITIINNNKPYLGFYKDNSIIDKGNPVIKLNMREIKNCISDKLSISIILETTILHELAHAIQNYFYEPYNENLAEDFAYDYFYSGIVNELES